MLAVAISPTRLIGMDTEFTGPYPRFQGALSAVTGGPPEDINMMPASLDPEREGPTKWVLHNQITEDIAPPMAEEIP